ncbi:MAG TPA: hypothetical protein VF411_12695 [Bacteroidia bacterium]
MRWELCLIIAGVILLTANCKESKRSEPDDNPNKCTQYECPIHLDKTSTKLENCPICGTVMIPIADSLKKDTLKHTLK